MLNLIQHHIILEIRDEIPFQARNDEMERQIEDPSHPEGSRGTASHQNKNLGCDPGSSPG